MSTNLVGVDALEVLKGATIEAKAGAWHLKLNAPQLDRKLYERVNQVLAILGGKWKGGRTAAHVFEDDPSDRLAAVLVTGLLPPKNPHAFFPTPHAVALEMLGLVGIPSYAEVRILEPSAGTGAIALAAREEWPNATIRCVELDPYNAKVLAGRGLDVTEADFLALDPAALGPFDVVLMNPPFAVKGNARAFADHVRHAEKFLGPEGVLLAVCPQFEHQSEAKVAGFRAWLEEARAVTIPLPGDAFKESGSGCRCCLVHIERPEVLAEPEPAVAAAAPEPAPERFALRSEPAYRPRRPLFAQGGLW
jgi:hypothetical protein